MKKIWMIGLLLLLVSCNDSSQVLPTSPSWWETETELVSSMNTMSMTEEEIKARLSPEVYKIAREDGTEAPFDNEYWNNTDEWIYVDILDGTALFSSTTKYKSWTGWPSFTTYIKEENIALKEDNTLFTKRTEVESATTGNHLWHVFDDGPTDQWGLRYCLNSAALKFIAKEDMAAEWYWEYMYLFDDES